MSDDDDAFDLLLATLRHKRNGAGQFALLRFGCRRPADCHTTHTQTHTLTHTHTYSPPSLSPERQVAHRLKRRVPDDARGSARAGCGLRRIALLLCSSLSSLSLTGTRMHHNALISGALLRFPASLPAPERAAA
jgi:hypothetical protein